MNKRMSLPYKFKLLPIAVFPSNSCVVLKPNLTLLPMR